MKAWFVHEPQDFIFSMPSVRTLEVQGLALTAPIAKTTFRADLGIRSLRAMKVGESKIARKVERVSKVDVSRSGRI